MNKYAANSFDVIEAAADTYKGVVKRVCEEWKRSSESAKAAAAAFKDEAIEYKRRMDLANSDARRVIQEAENVFTATVQGEIPGLREELAAHIAAKPGAGFLDALHVYYDFGIEPRKCEIEALLASNKGAYLGFRALDSLLSKTNAKYKLQYPTTDEFERDISTLEALAMGNIRWADSEDGSVFGAIFTGTPDLKMMNGKWVDTGARYDSSFRLGMKKADFDSKTQALAEMRDRWTAAVMPSAAHVVEKINDADSQQAAHDIAQEYIKDAMETAGTAAQVSTDGDAIAAQIAQKKTNEMKVYHDILADYQ